MIHIFHILKYNYILKCNYNYEWYFLLHDCSCILVQFYKFRRNFVHALIVNIFQIAKVLSVRFLCTLHFFSLSIFTLSTILPARSLLFPAKI